VKKKNDVEENLFKKKRHVPREEGLKVLATSPLKANGKTASQNMGPGRGRRPLLIVERRARGRGRELKKAP